MRSGCVHLLKRIRNILTILEEVFVYKVATTNINISNPIVRYLIILTLRAIFKYYVTNDQTYPKRYRK